MTAITVSFTAIADTAIDPDSPMDQALWTAVRDNIIHLREWIGASFTAGAIQDHNHDGSNSTLIEIGPNQVKNGSWEDGIDVGWSWVDYDGGSNAGEATNHRHGAKAAAITSTVLANGGSVGTQTGFTPCAEGDYVPWKYWVEGSLAGISSKLEIVWYQADQSTIVSTVTANQDTSTATSYALRYGAELVPANARYYRLQFTGGVPAVGTAVGTIYFDGTTVSDIPPIQEAMMAAASVNQAALKTAASAQSVQISTVSIGTIVLTGGTYSFLTVSSAGTGDITVGGNDTAAGTMGWYNTNSGSPLYVYVDGRYVQSSPPWRFGSGPTETDEIELFAMFILERATGKVLGISVAQDPPWAYNGPTIITPTHCGTIKDADDNDVVVPMRRELILPHTFNDTKGNPAKRAEYDAAMAKGARVHQDVVVDMDYKNRDMAVIPHCWPSGSAIDDSAFPTAVPVMLNPFNDGMFKLRHLLETGENIYEIFENGYLDFKQPMPMPGGPPGVDVIDWAWK